MKGSTKSAASYPRLQPHPASLGLPHERADLLVDDVARRRVVRHVLCGATSSDHDCSRYAFAANEIMLGDPDRAGVACLLGHYLEGLQHAVL